MRITAIGCGYVGLTTAIALAYLGHRVHCIDADAQKLKALEAGEVPIHEPGLQDLLGKVWERISFGSWDSFSGKEDVVIIAVGTPRKGDGGTDLSYVEAVALELGKRFSEDRLPLIVNKSTVPVGTARRVESLLGQEFRKRDMKVHTVVASNPEFLREGAALFDTFYPDRIVVGAKEGSAVNTLREMYEPIFEQTFVPPEFLPRPEGYPLPALVTTTPTSAELIKYAANTFLAMKISFINEIAGFTEKVGADIKEVARGVGLDRRIGSRYLNAGIGWGGSCFGKDVQALIHMASQYEYDVAISKAAFLVNERQREEIVKKLQLALKVINGHTIGLLGISFKPGTDDVRDAPAVTIAGRLLELGAHVRAYDPAAMDSAKKAHPDLPIDYVQNPEELFRGVDAVVLVTEWKEFLHLSFGKLCVLMRQRILIDGRNSLDPEELRSLGFTYIGIGR
jgi:UDPglucose 6-dehydrogenase